MRSPPAPTDHAINLFDIARQLNRLSPYLGNPERFFLDREKLAESLVAIARSLEDAQTKTAAKAGPLSSGDRLRKQAAFGASVCHEQRPPAMAKHGGRQ